MYFHLYASYMNFSFKKYDIFYVHIYKKNIYKNDFKFINVLDVSEFLENLVFNLRKKIRIMIEIQKPFV